MGGGNGTKNVVSKDYKQQQQQTGLTGMTVDDDGVVRSMMAQDEFLLPNLAAQGN